MPPDKALVAEAKRVGRALQVGAAGHELDVHDGGSCLAGAIFAKLGIDLTGLALVCEDLRPWWSHGETLGTVLKRCPPAVAAKAHRILVDCGWLEP